MDRRFSNAISSLADTALKLCVGLAKHWRTARVDQGYRPELHYMRGPGPKWREAQGIGEDRWLRLESVRQFHEDFESSSGAALLRARASAES